MISILLGKAHQEYMYSRYHSNSQTNYEQEWFPVTLPTHCVGPEHRCSTAPHPGERRACLTSCQRLQQSLSSADPVTPQVLPPPATFTAIWIQLQQYLYINTASEFTLGQGYVKATWQVLTSKITLAILLRLAKAYKVRHISVFKSRPIFLVLHWNYYYYFCCRLLTKAVFSQNSLDCSHQLAPDRTDWWWECLPLRPHPHHPFSGTQGQPQGLLTTSPAFLRAKPLLLEEHLDKESQ